jgi:hypothetical protein
VQRPRFDSTCIVMIQASSRMAAAHSRPLCTAASSVAG